MVFKNELMMVVLSIASSRAFPKIGQLSGICCGGLSTCCLERKIPPVSIAQQGMISPVQNVTGILLYNNAVGDVLFQTHLDQKVPY